MRKLLTFLVICTTLVIKSYSQTGEVRGFVYTADNGEPVGFVNILIKETRQGTASDENGFYSIAKLEPGKYTMICTSLGYDSNVVKIEIKANRIVKHDFFLTENSYDFDVVTVSAEK
jgi:hypothetical protein